MKSPDRPEPPLPPLPEIPKEIRNLHFLINQVLEFLTRLRPQLGFSIDQLTYDQILSSQERPYNVSLISTEILPEIQLFQERYLKALKEKNLVQLRFATKEFNDALVRPSQKIVVRLVLEALHSSEVDRIIAFLRDVAREGFSIESYDYFVLTQKPRGVDDKTFKSWVYRYYKITFLYTFAPLTGNK